ncbi:MAG: hypothetical protein ABI402_09715 [Ferruginibacter sp.]
MKIKAILNYIFASLILISFSCNDSNEVKPFPLEKKYWTADDYHVANFELMGLVSAQSELPNLDDPKTAPIFEKLVDTSNFTVVTNDTTLGLTHREKTATDMFNQYKDLSRSYSTIDRQDKYKYPVEFVKVLKFGLTLQIPYILLGNEKITKDSDNPNAEDVTSVVKRNGQVLIDNYNLYLDYINYEDRFNEKAMTEYISGIDAFFPRLINQLFPNGDYGEMSERIQNMIKKAKNTTLVQELHKINDLIKSKTAAKTA